MANNYLGEKTAARPAEAERALFGWEIRECGDCCPSSATFNRHRAPCRVLGCVAYPEDHEPGAFPHFASGSPTCLAYRTNRTDAGLPITRTCKVEPTSRAPVDAYRSLPWSEIMVVVYVLTGFAAFILAVAMSIVSQGSLTSVLVAAPIAASACVIAMAVFMASNKSRDAKRSRRVEQAYSTLPRGVVWC